MARTKAIVEFITWVSSTRWARGRYIKGNIPVVLESLSRQGKYDVDQRKL